MKSTSLTTHMFTIKVCKNAKDANTKDRAVYFLKSCLLFIVGDVYMIHCTVQYRIEYKYRCHAYRFLTIAIAGNMKNCSF